MQAEGGAGATLDTVRDVVRDALEDQGVLPKMRAQMYAEVFNCVHDPDQLKPTLPHEGSIINQLIREYLEYHQWEHTSKVLDLESGADNTSAASEPERARIHKVSTLRGLPLCHNVASGARHRVEAASGSHRTLALSVSAAGTQRRFMLRCQTILMRVRSMTDEH